jgi:hypothetical protein
MKRSPEPRSETMGGPDAMTPTKRREMDEHFQKTGAYRASDLRCLLGDPAQVVTLKASPGAPVVTHDATEVDKAEE